MKHRIVTLFLITLAANIFCIDFTNHDLILIKKIPVGNEPGQIGYGGISGGCISAPWCFAISKDNKIYVPDRHKISINIYDLDLNYIKMIKQKNLNYCGVATSMMLDNDNNILCFSSEYGIIKINQSGEKIYLLDKKNIPIPDYNLDSNHFFNIENYLFFYDNNSYVQNIDENGNIFSNNQSIKILEEINKKNSQSNNKEEDDIIVKIKKERKEIIIGNKFYTSQYYKFKNHYKDVSRNLKNKIDIDYKEIDIGRLVDYDRDHNSYWLFSYRNTKVIKKGGIFVYSNQGNIIDAFYASDLMYPSEFIISLTAIAPNGDVYFMKLDGEFYYFYKIERKW